MQPLPLPAAGYRQHLKAYAALLSGPHDFRVEADVLRMDESERGSLSARLIDGQVNLQRDATIKRTATLSLFDPDRALNLDKDSPFEGALFADRMVRVRHVVHLPGVGDVETTPFVGPVVKVSRTGDVLNVECQDKTLLAVEGVRRHKTVKKGRNAVQAIEAVMRDCTGERRFRFPKGNKRRLSKSYTVGLKPEAAPWMVCQRIAKSIGMDLFYSCDGALVLRERPKGAVFTFAEGTSLTATPTAQHDVSSVRNLVSVTGDRKVKGRKNPVKFTRVAAAKPGHSLSAQSLGRNGVPRWLPLLIDESDINKASQAQKRARDELGKSLPAGASISFSATPVFHLDYGDLVLVRTSDGDAKVPFVEASIPLGLGGDMTVGVQRRVSLPGRRR